MAHAYIFYGKSGSGKGTQAKLLKAHLESQGRSVLYIETGQLLRNFAAEHNSLSARYTKEVLDQGGLMPVFFPIYLWGNELIQKFDGTQDLIIDGAARRIEEAPALESALSFLKIQDQKVFHIHITDETAQTRLSSRVEGRADDADAEKIKSRLDWYVTNVLPVLEYFHKSTQVEMIEIDGEPDVDGVWKQIETKI